MKKTCCSQAFVFPRQKASDLVQWYEEKPHRKGDVDVVIAKYVLLYSTPTAIDIPAEIRNYSRNVSDDKDLPFTHKGVVWSI